VSSGDGPELIAQQCHKIYEYHVFGHIIKHDRDIKLVYSLMSCNDHEPVDILSVPMFKTTVVISTCFVNGFQCVPTEATCCHYIHSHMETRVNQ
jgi:hypothetical protein